jgi:hypothetical protein
MTNSKSFISALLVALGVLTFSSSAWAACNITCDEGYFLMTDGCYCVKGTTTTQAASSQNNSQTGAGKCASVIVCDALTETLDETTCECKKNYEVSSFTPDTSTTTSDSKTTSSAKSTAKASGSTTNSGSFCSSDLGIFSELVQTGQLIFNRLRDLIYVVAGFGIIAVAVGGFFGNLNWKWLGAIVISLVVIATAGELVVALTGCEAFSSSLVTNTLTQPSTAMSGAEFAQKWAEAPDAASNTSAE